MDDVISAYQELMEAAQKVLAARALQENGAPVSNNELKRRQLRLEAATDRMVRLSSPEYRTSQSAQLQLV